MSLFRRVIYKASNKQSKGNVSFIRHAISFMRITSHFFKTKSFACKTLARPRYCAAINSISAVCASSRSVFYVIGNCIAISYYIKKEVMFKNTTSFTKDLKTISLSSHSLLYSIFRTLFFLLPLDIHAHGYNISFSFSNQKP